MSAGGAPGRPDRTEPDGGAEAIRALIRPHLHEAEPYRTARSQHLGGILLDANESAFGPLAQEADPGLHRYPDPANAELKSALSQLCGAPTARLWVGNGSDEAIDVLIRALVAPGQEVVVATPTYGVYGARARTHGARVVELRLDEDFDLDVDRTAEAARDARLVFLCSPNNPTGNVLSEDRILELVRRTRCLVAVDEAYVEFSPRPSLAGRPGGPARLAVLRTFSKAWGLAGARVGWLAAHPELVRFLDIAGLPYPLSRLAARAALRALELEEEMESRVRRVREERRRLRAGLEALGLDAAPSEANFLLFFVRDPGEIQRRLAAEHGVVVRDRSGLPGLEGGLRVTVGTPDENDRFLAGLEEVLDR